jgi:hypothetical protein
LLPDSSEEIVFLQARRIHQQGLRVHVLVDVD